MRVTAPTARSHTGTAASPKKVVPSSLASRRTRNRNRPFSSVPAASTAGGTGHFTARECRSRSAASGSESTPCCALPTPSQVQRHSARIADAYTSRWCLICAFLASPSFFTPLSSNSKTCAGPMSGGRGCRGTLLHLDVEDESGDGQHAAVATPRPRGARVAGALWRVSRSMHGCRCRGLLAPG